MEETGRNLLFYYTTFSSVCSKCILEILWQCAPYGSKVYVSLELNFASGEF